MRPHQPPPTPHMKGDNRRQRETRPLQSPRRRPHQPTPIPHMKGDNRRQQETTGDKTTSEPKKPTTPTNTKAARSKVALRTPTVNCLGRKQILGLLHRCVLGSSPQVDANPIRDGFWNGQGRAFFTRRSKDPKNVGSAGGESCDPWRVMLSSHDMPPNVSRFTSSEWMVFSLQTNTLLKILHFTPVVSGCNWKTHVPSKEKSISSRGPILGIDHKKIRKRQKRKEKDISLKLSTTFFQPPLFQKGNHEAETARYNHCRNKIHCRNSTTPTEIISKVQWSPWTSWCTCPENSGAKHSR